MPSKNSGVTICIIETLTIIVVENLIGFSLLEVVLYIKFENFKIKPTNNPF